MLLEISLLKSFREDRNAMINLGQMTPDKVKETFLQKARCLHAVFGTAFREAVLVCSNGQFVHGDEDYRLLGDFRHQVCDRLDEIKVS